MVHMNTPMGDDVANPPIPDNHDPLTGLKALPQWVAYTSGKVPIDPHTGGPASTADPSTWGTLQKAWATKKQRNLAGVGFVFTRAAGVVGVDLDDCFDAAGELKPDAADVVQCLSSYTELSPSGRGLHILIRGEIPHSLKASDKGIEIYDELRYFTVTGRGYGDYGQLPIAQRQDELLAIWATYGGDLNEPKLPDVKPSAPAEWSERDIADMLAVLPAWGDYGSDWLPILMAVHSVYPDERGVSLCEAWSPGKPGEVRRKFRSFDNTARDGVTIGTLVHKAKQYGWHPPGRSKPKRSVWDMRRALAEV